jgi:[ribosomal protein S18]-alanine N-acetyltransferase
MERTRIRIRWMIRRDLPEVLTIEGKSFPDPLDEEQILERLRQRNCIGMVADTDDGIIGFMIYELHKRRLHILRLAVSPEIRRTGVGAQLIARLKHKLATHCRLRLTVSVRDDGGAKPFFLSHDFEVVHGEQATRKLPEPFDYDQATEVMAALFKRRRSLSARVAGIVRQHADRESATRERIRRRNRDRERLPIRMQFVVRSEPEIDVPKIEAPRPKPAAVRSPLEEALTRFRAESPGRKGSWLVIKSK